MRRHIYKTIVILLFTGCAGNFGNPQTNEEKGLVLLKCKYFLFGLMESYMSGVRHQTSGDLSAGGIRPQIEDYFSSIGFKVINRHQYGKLPDEEKAKVLTSSCRYYWHLDYSIFPGNNKTVIRFSMSLFPKSNDISARYKKSVGFGGAEIYSGIQRTPTPSGEAVKITLNRLTKFIARIRSNRYLIAGTR